MLHLYQKFPKKNVLPKTKRKDVELYDQEYIHFCEGKWEEQSQVLTVVEVPYVCYVVQIV